MEEMKNEADATSMVSMTLYAVMYPVFNEVWWLVSSMREFSYCFVDIDQGSGFGISANDALTVAQDAQESLRKSHSFYSTASSGCTNIILTDK